MIITISRDDLEEKDKKVWEKVGQAKITSGLIVEGDQVDGTADDHLEQLQTCDHHRKPCRHLDPAQHILASSSEASDEATSGNSKENFTEMCLPHGSEGIVGVHDGVDAVVHHHEPPASGGEDTERVKPVAHHRQMVIPATATC